MAGEHGRMGAWQAHRGRMLSGKSAATTMTAMMVMKMKRFQMWRAR